MVRIVFAVVVYSFSVGEYITKIRVGALKHDVPDHIFFTFMYTGCLVFFKNFYSIVWIWYRLRQRCTANKKIIFRVEIFYHLIIIWSLYIFFCVQLCSVWYTPVGVCTCLVIMKHSHLQIMIKPLYTIWLKKINDWCNK